MQDVRLTARDAALISRLDEPLRPLAIKHLNLVRHHIHTQNLRCRAHLFETFREHGRQWDLYASGRTKAGRVVTNATPEDTPHCFMRDGQPAARAWDLWLLELEEEAILPDGDPRWGLVPYAVALVNKENAGPRIISGAFFKSIRGGDWPHVEEEGWRG